MMEDKPKYPTINNMMCPSCGGTRRMADEVLQQQIVDGKIKLVQAQVAYLFTYESIIAPPSGMWLSAPVILSFFDVCVECGTMYCVHAEVVMGVQDGKNVPKPKAGRGFSVS